MNDSKASDGYLVGKSGARPTKPASAYLEAVPNCILRFERGKSTQEKLIFLSSKLAPHGYNRPTATNAHAQFNTMIMVMVATTVINIEMIIACNI